MVGEVRIVVQPGDLQPSHTDASLLELSVRHPTEALERLLREQGLAEELRRRGLERAARFSWRAAAERLLALLPAPSAVRAP